LHGNCPSPPHPRRLFHGSNSRNLRLQLQVMQQDLLQQVVLSCFSDTLRQIPAAAVAAGLRPAGAAGCRTRSRWLPACEWPPAWQWWHPPGHLHVTKRQQQQHAQVEPSGSPFDNMCTQAARVAMQNLQCTAALTAGCNECCLRSAAAELATPQKPGAPSICYKGQNRCMLMCSSCTCSAPRICADARCARICRVSAKTRRFQQLQHHQFRLHMHPTC
jgi:hypothetical protein